MKVVIRNYTGPGAAELMNLLEKESADVKSVISSIPGLVSYTLGRASGGGFSVTVCQDQAGIDASVAAARDWIVKNASHIKAAPPEVTMADAFLHF